MCGKGKGRGKGVKEEEEEEEENTEYACIDITHYTWDETSLVCTEIDREEREREREVVWSFYRGGESSFLPLRHVERDRGKDLREIVKCVRCSSLQFECGV